MITLTAQGAADKKYDGTWTFDVTVNKVKDDMFTVKLEVTGQPPPKPGRLDYLGDTYVFPVSTVADGTYTFGGTELGTKNASAGYDLDMSGTINPMKETLTITNNVLNRFIRIERARG